MQLNVATLQETVTVSGESPVIDTSATRMQTNYDQQALASIPNARDMWSLLATTPSVTLNRVDVGGSTMGTQTTYFAYGYSGQNRPLIEGHQHDRGHVGRGLLSRLRLVRRGVHRRGGQLGRDAEPRRADAVRRQERRQHARRSASTTTTRTATSRAATSRRIRRSRSDAGRTADGRTIREDGNRLASYKNLNLGVGGPIVRDRVWGHFAYLNQHNSVAAPPVGRIQDGTPFDTKLFNYTGKGTYQMNQNNKFIGYLQHGTKQQPNRTDSSNRLGGAPIHITADSTVLQDSPSWVYKGEWNGTIGQNMFAEFRAGQFGYNFGLDSNTDDDALRGSRHQRRSPAAAATG